ncbi:MAG: sigma-70 family RNA polymerase sigma factor [Chitinophagaceae bacterium]|nr:sigma-70 family RNA polymerase sigma factor [Chitinophagaceae bacterium]
MRNDSLINYCWKDFVENESRDAYYTLYRHYYAYFCYIGVKKSMSTEAVKDTINDVFLYLWEKRKSLDHVNNPHNYILTFFHRSVLKKLQQPDVLLDETDENTVLIYEAFTEPSFEENLLEKENNESLSRIVNRHLNFLPRQQREIMYQKFFLGLSYAEIAKANKLSVNTVYNTVYSAIQKLRASIPVRVIASLISACTAFFIFFS